MDILWQELAAELGDGVQLARIVLRLLLAGVMGSFVGLQREHAGESAGWRTHILVTMGAALFIMAVHESGGSQADLSRVVQGVATGIGFVGAGAILKMNGEGKVKGLTTAASVWLTAGVGVAIGLGRIWTPLVGSILGWFTLSWLARWEHHVQLTNPPHEP